MLVLHATWREPGSLHVWAESDRVEGNRASGRHPFAATGREARMAFAGVLAAGQATGAGDLKEDEAALALPTVVGKPVPSHPALNGGLDQTLEPALAKWQVPGAVAPAGEAVEWLTALPRRGEEPAGVAIGDDLRWFAGAARLVLELVIRERYVPTAPEGVAGGPARWEPLLSAPGMLERSLVLARAMPGSCRAATGTKLTREEVLAQFLRAAVNEFIQARHDAPGAAAGAALRWLASLGTGAARAGVPADATFLDAIRSWVGPALAAEPYEGFRTCLQLDPPRPLTQRARPGEAGAPTWQVRFLLQPVENPEKTVPAAELWRTRSRLTPERRAAAQDRLLADLLTASRFFPALSRSMQSHHPRSVALSVHEAHMFLTEAASQLAESGIAVIIPPELARGRARLGTRMRLKPTAAAEQAEQGLESLVQFDLALALGDMEVSEPELRALIEARLPLVQLRGRWVELRPGDIKAAADILDRKSSELPLAEALFSAWGAGEAEGLPVVSVEAEGWLEKLLGDGEARLEPVPVPANFRGTLRPYQERGLAWLDFLRRVGGGACLADDMGLGKTIQALALFLRHQGVDTDGKPSLLVAPTSVLGNWERETARFAPSLKVLLHHGPDRAHGTPFARAALKHDLVVTSYALLTGDRETLRQVTWDTVLLDEAQNIKNPHAQVAQAARALTARHRIAMTGTPVENRLQELWSIFQFLNPGFLGTLETFRANLANPIEREHSAPHANRLRRLVAPFLLRRAKTDPGIAPELPPKIETTETCRLTKEQAALYAAVVKDMMERIERTQGIERKGLVLATLTKLKQVCNHPALFRGDHSALPRRSGKLARLDELLEEITGEGQRALVFTQYAEMAELLRRHLAATVDAEVLLLHGGTPRLERERLIARFQDTAGGPKVFILSLKAGGTGLNLTAASHVLHFDRWWNPAVEAQATDRAYRIGQQQTVQVHAFVTQGTLEERIADMLESKKALAGKIVGTGENWITELSTANLRDLFSLRAETLAEEE